MRGKRGVIGVGNQNQNNFGRTVQQTATGMVSHDSRIEQYKSYDSVSHFGHSNVYSNIATSYISDPRSVWMSSDGYHLYIGSSTSVVHWKLSVPWEIDTRTYLYTWAAPDGGSYAMAWSQKGEYFYRGSWSQDRTLSYKTPKNWYLKDPDDDYSSNIVSQFSNYDKNSTVYANSGTGKGTNLRDLRFKPDGTKVFLLDWGKDRVMHWDLSTPWDIQSITNASDGFDFNDGTYRDNAMAGMDFSSDGSKLFLNGANSDDTFRWDLSTPWDLSGTVTYYGNWAVGDHRGFTFNKTGDASTEGKYYYYGTGNGYVRMYTLETPYDITGTKTLHSSFIYMNDSGDVHGLSWNTDGTQLAVVQDDRLNILRFSSPWDWDTYVDRTSFSITQLGTQIYNVQGIEWGGNQGEFLFMVDNGKGLVRGNLEVPNEGRSFNDGVHEGNVSNDNYESFQWSTDGKKFFIQDNSDNVIYQYETADWAPPYFINSHTPVHSKTSPGFTNYQNGFCITPDGKNIFSLDSSLDKIIMYRLGDPFDMTSYAGSTGNHAAIAVYNLESNGSDLFMSPDGRIMLMVGTTQEELWEWRPHYK